MINADWIQLNCRVKPFKVEYCKLDFDADGQTIKNGMHRTELVESNQPRFHRDYKVEKQAIRTSLADSVYYVYYKSLKIAEVLADMHPDMHIDTQTVFVRFDNKFLYAENLYDRVLKFLDDNELVFHNWTRFDVCCDFEKFLDGWGKKNLVPSDFIKRYMDGKVRLLNRRRGRKRKGCVWFEDGEKGIDFQSLKLGSNYSAVNTKLYNKSQELKDVEDKPYIREQWQQNGMDNKSCDVWRLEFKITDFNSIVIDDDTLAMTLKSLEILKDENIGLLWNVLREHYFQFYKEDGTKNVTRKKKVELFDYQETGMKLREISGKVNTTRTHKIFIKKLLDTQQVIRENNDMKKIAFATDYIAAWLVERHDLFEWCETKFPSWKPHNYTEPPIIDFPVIQFTLMGDGSKQSERFRHTL